MRAMVFEAPGRPLRPADLPRPEPAEGQVLLRVLACAVCRTDLHLLDGEVDVPDPPRVLGHQIVGEVIEGSGDIAPGARIGVPWLGWTDGTCRFCTTGRENLCVQARFTGRDVDGGYAEYAVVDARYCFAIPDGYPDLQAAPLLCAGLIGFRALRLAGDGERLGLYGFGASAHIICQVAAAEGRRVFAFTRGGDEATQAFARELGAEWAGDSLGPAPEPLEATRVVPAPREDVFAFLSDLGNHWAVAGRWIEVVALDGGGDGGRVRIRGPFGLRRTAITSVDRVQPPDRLQGTALLGRTRAEVAWTLHARGAAATEVELAA